MRIFLVGYMGCGKSSIGKRMANKLGYLFIDLDEWIERQQNLSINELFEKKGETCFRQMEQHALKEITDENDKIVVATGGGTPCFYDNMSDMNRKGLTVYIQMDASSLVHRLRYAKKTRPLIAGKTEEELLFFVKQNLKDRESYYKQAKIILNGLMPDSLLTELIIRSSSMSY